VGYRQGQQSNVIFVTLLSHKIPPTSFNLPLSVEKESDGRSLLESPFAPSMSQLVSSAVLSAVGLACKAFLNSGLCSITVSNLPVLLDALSSERKYGGQGLITGMCCIIVHLHHCNLVTVSNHLSTSVHTHFCRRSTAYLLSSLDDPVIWGILPFEYFTNTRTIRWVLGASDIAFTNPSVERRLHPILC
jgi:hypothetical protein